MAVFPMDIRLKILTQNSAHRLHRVSRESQLLKRLSSEWCMPQPHDNPLPTPNTQRMWTTLRALAAQVPAKGPRIQLFPDLHPEAPTWNNKVICCPKQANQDYQQTVVSITNACKIGKAVNIFTTGVYSNKHRQDGKQLGVASAVLYHEG